jgi:hypothetical protein
MPRQHMLCCCCWDIEAAAGCNRAAWHALSQRRLGLLMHLSLLCSHRWHAGHQHSSPATAYRRRNCPTAPVGGCTPPACGCAVLQLLPCGAAAVDQKTAATCPTRTTVACIPTARPPACCARVCICRQVPAPCACPSLLPPLPLLHLCAHILDSLLGAPPVTLATRRPASSVFSSLSYGGACNTTTCAGNRVSTYP